MGFVDDRGAVHRHVHNAAPHPQQTRAPDMRQDRHAAFADVFDHGQIAALGIRIVAVDDRHQRPSRPCQIGCNRNGLRQR